MGAYLVHIRLKIAVEHAEELVDSLVEDAGNCFSLGECGDTVHLLVQHRIGAGQLKNQLAGHLANSIVADYGIVEIRDQCSEWEEDDEADTNGDTGSELEEWLWESEAEPELTAGEWLSKYASARPRAPGYSRRGLLIITNYERERSRQLALIDRMLGKDVTRHWHGRNSVMYAYWDNRRVENVLTMGKLAEAVAHRELQAAYAFDLLSDLETMHGPMSSLASWYKRDFTHSQPKARQPLVAAPGNFHAARQPTAAVKVEYRGRPRTMLKRG